MDSRRVAVVRARKGRARTVIFLTVCTLVVACLIPQCGCGVKQASENSTAPSTTLEQNNSVTQGQTGGPSESEQALAQAKTEGKPVLLCFHSTKCIPCIEMEKNLNQVMPEYQGKVEFVIVDVYDPTEESLNRQYGIQTIPTTFLLKGDGQVANSFQGALTPDQLRKELDALL